MNNFKKFRQDWDGKVPEFSHKDLVNRAFMHLKNSIGCSVVFKERQAACAERPDAIGFKYGSYSILIECKTSRSDFLADHEKFFRQNVVAGMGVERYFMAPVGVLSPEDMPHGWGLLEVYKRKRKNAMLPVIQEKDSIQFADRNKDAEITYLVASIRRIEISMAVFVDKNIK